MKPQMISVALRTGFFRSKSMKSVGMMLLLITLLGILEDVYLEEKTCTDLLIDGENIPYLRDVTVAENMLIAVADRGGLTGPK